MLQKQIFITILFLFTVAIACGQYVNTDSLVFVPGMEEPVSLAEYDEMFRDLTPQTSVDYHSTGALLEAFDLPHNNKVISRFGPRRGRMHYGTDIRMATGDTVRAVFDGKIVRSRYYSGFGNLIVVQHPKNIKTYYAHLSKYLSRTGDWVKKGEAIGLAGRTGRATGSHLHFEIREKDRAYDPELVFDFENNEVRNDVASVNSLEELQRRLIPKGYSVNVGVPQYYKVRSGDSLWRISRKFKMSIKRICSLNRISENATLQIGQPLKLY